MRHEAAFLIGASRNKKAASVLFETIANDSSELVQHEAIEALGDLGLKTKAIKNLLRTLCKAPNPFIKDTAKIALKTLDL